MRARATVRPESASLPRSASPHALSSVRALSRRATTASCRGSGHIRSRPASAWSSASENEVRAVSKSLSAAGVAPVCFLAAECAAESIASVRLPVRADVTRSRSSWASSMMTAECDGSTEFSPKASIASRAWLVTTTSAPEAFVRASSAQHSSTMGHFWPRQS